jgi:hypothetical protein
VKASPGQTGGAFAFSGDHGVQLPRAHAVECFDNDLDGVRSNLGNQNVAHGVLLQHVGSVMQIEFADVEVRTGVTARSEQSNRGRGQPLRSGASS